MVGPAWGSVLIGRLHTPYSTPGTYSVGSVCVKCPNTVAATCENTTGKDITWCDLPLVWLENS